MAGRGLVKAPISPTRRVSAPHARILHSFTAGACVLPYWILFLVFALGALQYGRRASPSGAPPAPFLGVASMLIVILVGLRFEVGADWATYIEIFDDARNLDWDELFGRGDPGYTFLNTLAHTVGLEVWSVNFVCALIFTFGLVKFARHQPNPWLAILVGVPYLIIVVAMGYSRQGVAIGLIMAAITEFERNRWIRFGLYILVAAAFHKTAIIILPLVAMTSTRHRAVIAAVIAVMGYLFYGWFLEAGVDKLVTNYLEAEYSSQGAAIRVAMNLVPAALILIYPKRFAMSEQQTRLWRNFAIAAFAMLALLIALPSSTAVDRIALYIIPLQLVVLSRVPDAFPSGDGGRNVQLMLAVILYSAVIQFVWLTFANHAEYWLPYQIYPLIGG